MRSYFLLEVVIAAVAGVFSEVLPDMVTTQLEGHAAKQSGPLAATAATPAPPRVVEVAQVGPNAVIPALMARANGGETMSCAGAS